MKHGRLNTYGEFSVSVFLKCGSFVVQIRILLMLFLNPGENFSIEDGSMDCLIKQPI
jgi:hypothetical protein